MHKPPPHPPFLPRQERTCIVLCTLRNDDGTPPVTAAQPAFYEQFFLTPGSGGLADYYRDVTHGRVQIVGDVYGWLDSGHTVAEHLAKSGGPQRVQAFEWGLQAARDAGIAVDGYPRQVVVLNHDTDWGGVQGGRSMLLPHSATSPWSHSRAAHEFGHVLGLNDAWSTTVTPAGTVDTAYTDDHCIMSYQGLGHRYTAPAAGVAMETGPGLNGVYTRLLDGIPPARLSTLPAILIAETVVLAPLTHADVGGVLLAQIPPTPQRPQTCWVELHHKSHWDREIPASRVAVHETRPGDANSYVLVVSGGRQELSHVDDEALVTTDGSVAIRLAQMNADTAAVRIWELGTPNVHELRFSRIFANPPGDPSDEECVVLRNDRLRTASLRGFTLSAEAGAALESPRYVFGSVRLEPGEDLTLWTGRGRRDRHNLYWGLDEAVWGAVGGGTAVLADSTGAEIARLAYGNAP
jgi:hypothetical protein